MEEKHDFELSADELECLQRLAAEDDERASLLPLQVHLRSLSVVITLSRSEAELLRDRLTTLLALVGFDENYAANEQGQMLENLIDKFYLCE